MSEQDRFLSVWVDAETFARLQAIAGEAGDDDAGEAAARLLTLLAADDAAAHAPGAPA